MALFFFFLFCVDMNLMFHFFDMVLNNHAKNTYNFQTECFDQFYFIIFKRENVFCSHKYHTLNIFYFFIMFLIK